MSCVGKMHPRGCCVYVVALVAFVVLLQVPKSRSVEEEAVDAETQQTAVAVEDEYTDDDNRYCENVDVRNSPARLEHIRNCTVITGFLQIVLIERTPQTEFKKYEFKNLREVTGYILIFRVFGLTTLRDLFPNLMIIRGQKLIGPYALMFYSLRDFEEIGLKNLIAIPKGFVYSQDCPKMCHTDTIDWATITHQSNRTTREMNRFDKPVGVCNNSEVCRGCSQPFCWGSKTCQRFDTGFNHMKTIKCHKQCIGGCDSREDTGCRVCRGPKEGRRCVEKCSEDKVLFHLSMRCISKQKCVNRGGLMFQGECLEECPPGYSPDNVNQLDADFSNHTCYPCQTRCPKICEGQRVMYLSEAEQLDGCTIINGTLVIRIAEDAPNLMDVLRNALGSIEEIMGYLKIYRSNTLSSLEFLENLITIHGHNEFNQGNYSLMVYENMNLQKLWNPGSKRSLRLISGAMYFVFNPLLCVSKIGDLQNATEHNSTNDFIDVGTNGFRQSCNVISLVTHSAVWSSKNVTLFWTKYKPLAHQKLLGYIVYFTQSDGQKSPHDDRDVCSEYSWQSKLVMKDDLIPVGIYLSHNLTGLRPLTKYAYFIETYVRDDEMNFTDRRIGQSEVRYFHTKLDRPTQPIHIYTTRKTDHSITISWVILRSEENLVKNLQVDVFIQPDNVTILDQRNFCLYPRQPAMLQDSVDVCSAEVCCSEYDLLKNIPDILESDHDVDIVSRRKRSANIGRSSIFAPKEKFHDGFHDKFQKEMYDLLNEPSSIEPPEVKSSRKKRETVELVNRVANYTFDAILNEFTISNLLPFTYYTFQLFACSAIEFEFCSAYHIYSDRTEPSPTGGQPPTLTMVKNASSAVDNATIAVRFAEPNPLNSAVVAFNVELKSIDTLNSIHRLECITRLAHERAGFIYAFHNLTIMGLYAVRVQVVDLAGPAQFSEWVYGVVKWQEPPSEDHSVRNGLITFGVLFSVTILAVGAYALYRKYKTHHDDKVPLVENDVNELVNEYGFVDCPLR